LNDRTLQETDIFGKIIQFFKNQLGNEKIGNTQNLQIQ